MPRSTTRSSDVPTIDTFGPTGPRERSYLTRVFGILNDAEQLRSTEALIDRETRAFVRDNREQLRPKNLLAVATLLKTIAGVTVPIAAAYALVMRGIYWPSLLLVPLSGLALYGATSILHDTVHGAFFRGKRANEVLGKLLAPIFLLDFNSFRISHAGHHRYSQSVESDPKYPKLPWSASKMPEGAMGDDFDASGWNAVTRAVTGAWLSLAKRVVRAPAPVRGAFYIASIIVFGGPTALLFGGEVALLQRDWKSRGPWLSLLRSVLLYVGLFRVSPTLGLMALGAAWFAMSCFFMLFLTHLSPYQLYLLEGKNGAPKLMTLNVSDIRLGLLTRLLGNKFSEYHAAHHMFPFVPSYRLERAGRWLDEQLGHLKAPVVEPLSVHDATLLGDGIIATVTRPEQSLPRWNTVAGSFMRRTAALPADAPAAARAPQRFSIFARAAERARCASC